MINQLSEAAQQIALLKHKPSDTIIRTVPCEVEKIVIKEVAKRPAGTDVILNQ